MSTISYSNESNVSADYPKSEQAFQDLVDILVQATLEPAKGDPETISLTFESRPGEYDHTVPLAINDGYDIEGCDEAEQEFIVHMINILGATNIPYGTVSEYDDNNDNDNPINIVYEAQSVSMHEHLAAIDKLTNLVTAAFGNTTGLLTKNGINTAYRCPQDLAVLEKVRNELLVVLTDDKQLRTSKGRSKIATLMDAYRSTAARYDF